MSAQKPVKIRYVKRPMGGQLIDGEREYIYDKKGRLVEIRIAGGVGIYNGPRSKEPLPNNWEPEE